MLSLHGFGVCTLKPKEMIHLFFLICQWQKYEKSILRIINYFSFDWCVLKAVYNGVEIALHFLREKKIQPPVVFIIAGVSKVSHFVRK
jgi:hypothetical protein